MNLNDKELEEAFKNILDTFSGADGGVKFMHFRIYIEDLDKEEYSADKQALSDIVIRMSRFIDVTNVERY